MSGEKTTVFHALFILLLASCTMPATMSEDSKNKVIRCTDTRDGEEFIYNTNDVSEIRAGIGGASVVTLTDSEGRVRTISSTAEAWLKCVEVKDEDDS